jgi:tetratricopeptide (TPR) repeat protein
MMRRRWAWALGSIIVLIGLAWWSARTVANRRFATGLTWARKEINTGRVDAARRWLEALPKSRLSDPDAADLLGVCEHEAGNYEAALAAWSLIPPSSPRTHAAVLARAQTLVTNLGRFADAEAVLESALRQPGSSSVELRHALGQLYFWESRPAAMRRLIIEGRREWRNSAAELRDLWQIDDATVAIEDVRAAIAAASRLAPNDDRVWLAQAGLDTLEGRFDEAKHRLDACAKRRPDDPGVWEARLKLARASGDPAGAQRALAHLPADALPESELLDIGAWFAARRGDFEDERRILERRIKVGPVDLAAFEWLAVLYRESGRTDQSALLRRRKSELDPLKDRYRRLLVEREPVSHFDEPATLAEALDRPIEAYGWWTLAYRQRPGDSAAFEGLRRLAKRIEATPGMMSGTLLDRMASLLPASAGGPPLLRTAVSQVRAPSPLPALASFRDDAGPGGLHFVFDNGQSYSRQLPETTAGGVGLLDFDGDGWLDIYVVQGGAFPPDSTRPNTGDRLFRNQRDGTFVDATEPSGIARMPRGFGHGVAVGDIDNDGRADLFITRWQSYALYHNRGDGTFEDSTARAGLAGDRDWPTSAAFADFDNDGDLDLYVCHYLVWDAMHPGLCERKPQPGEPVDPSRRYDYCMPNPFPSQPDHLFRNDGGRFVDVTDLAGIVDPNGRGLGVIAADLDDDGWVDLFVANDTTANYYYRNKGGMRFEEIATSAGIACNAVGAFQAGMGTACGDVDGDGLPDLLVTNFYGESTSYFKNMGKGMFADQTSTIGLAAASRFVLGFGIALFDANNDGRLDLAQTNGHVVDSRPAFPLEMPGLIMIGDDNGRLSDITAKIGPPWSTPRIGRGLAVGDLDNDGRTDVVIVPHRTPLAFLHNQTNSGGRAVDFLLQGTRSNRDGVGAVVTIKAGGRTRRGWRYGGGSFQSASDPRVHFGLGQDRIDEVEVRWPSGQVDRFANLQSDRSYRLREGDQTPTVLESLSRRQASNGKLPAEPQRIAPRIGSTQSPN